MEVVGNELQIIYDRTIYIHDFNRFNNIGNIKLLILKILIFNNKK